MFSVSPRLVQPVLLQKSFPAAEASVVFGANRSRYVTEFDYPLETLPFPLTELLRQVIQQPTPHQALARMADAESRIPGFKKVDDLTYHYKGYTIKAMLRDYANEFVKKAEQVKALNLSCAPKILEHIRLENYISIVISQYPNQGDDPLLPYDDVFVLDRAKRQFLDEMTGLLNAGLSHRFAPKGKASWRINPATKGIVLTDWQTLEPLNPDKKNEYLASIRKLLRLR